MITSPYYQQVTDLMEESAIDELEKIGASYNKITVPGVFEIAPALKMVSQSSFKYDGYLLFGCVIRGETSHYDLICQANALSVQDLSIKYNLAIGYGVLTCENIDQALIRADRNKKNKGLEATQACLEMIKLRKELSL